MASTMTTESSVHYSVTTVQPTPAPTPTPTPSTRYEREDGVVTLDWSKCCDSEDDPIRPPGTPCEISLIAGDMLILSWDSVKRHNIFSVPDESAFDDCYIEEAEEVGGGEDGTTSFNVSLNFPSAGTFFYVCAYMCQP